MSFWKQLLGAQKPRIEIPELSENDDPLYPDAAAFVMSSGSCSVSSVQRHLKIGYSRAATLIEALENDLVISSMSPEGVRHLLTGTERQQARLRPSKAETLQRQQDEQTAMRLSYLLEKYGDETVVKHIMNSMLWEGMTAAHLFDSLGDPEAVDQKYLKQVSREVWKYDSQGGNRYRLRITLENGIVVGWDKKE